MKFEHVEIDSCTPGEKNSICLIAPVDADDYNDIIIGGEEGDGNVVWYRYPDWTRHTIGTARLEAGGAVLDMTGNGWFDLVAGEPDDGELLFWFENPGRPHQRWTQWLITDEFQQYQGQCVGDVDGDGEDELVVLSRGAGVVVYYDIPPDPHRTPWPEKSRHFIAEDLQVESAAIVDLDGDGRSEVVAGPYAFRNDDGDWTRHGIAPDYRRTCVAVGDLDGDGNPEVVLSEGGLESGRLAWFDGFPNGKEHLIEGDLFRPQSLQVADMNGDGRPDIFVAEMGLGKNEDPRMFIYLNRGEGQFEKTAVDDPRPVHNARVGHIGDHAMPCIVGKPYAPGRSVHLWINHGEGENEDG